MNLRKMQTHIYQISPVSLCIFTLSLHIFLVNVLSFPENFMQRLKIAPFLYQSFSLLAHSSFIFSNSTQAEN